ncbi:siderophore-interacting protein [Pelagibacterium luteolum]|uniref:NADPH-dependent ferric siderophore reductase, contains FAD-binding and SIP domains n=1 Tax=Pelagibacterium luteolum TaxID=440168 RepID=A0A1G7WAQ7_9HYPH|nr:siderophore-interacting protein [Pelagibacterium luteolum]SDG69086.1 NADPH-dependent ferric siderophore reductase, contains FAD-binding and SIP domains [Pelagibacterium luteolum]
MLTAPVNINTSTTTAPLEQVSVVSQMFHQATVIASTAITPGMVRVVFSGAGLASFVTTGVPDEYLRLFFPNPETGRLHLPHISEDGRWSYPDGQDTIRCSTYTVRRAYTGADGSPCIDIDFVVHKGGVASEWAMSAQPGQVITINRPRGLYSPPADAQWQLLVADATGLPALSRILDQTPAHIQSRVFVEVADAEHEQLLPHHSLSTVTWLRGCGNGVAASRLEEVVRSVPLPATPGYVWVAGEQKVVRAIRKFVRKDLALPAERYELVGYWIANSEEWDAKWEALDPAIKARIDAAWDSDRDKEDVMDEYNATLEKFGL